MNANTTEIPKEMLAPESQVPESQVISKMLDSKDIKEVRSPEGAESPHQETPWSEKQTNPEAYTLD